MAKFCTSCGSAAQEDMKFCLNCGKPIGTPATASAGPAPSGVPSRPSVPAGNQATPVAKNSSPVLKIVLIVVGVIVLLGVLSTATCVYFAYRAKQKAEAMIETAKTMSMQGTPEVNLEAGEGSEAAKSATADVPPYPGSIAVEAGGNLSFGDASIGSQQYETEDSVDKVIAFYKEKFGNQLKVQQAGGNAMLQLSTKTGLTTVTISREEEANKTRISLTRIGK